MSLAAGHAAHLDFDRGTIAQAQAAQAQAQAQQAQAQGQANEEEERDEGKVVANTFGQSIKRRRRSDGMIEATRPNTIEYDTSLLRKTSRVDSSNKRRTLQKPHQKGL